MRINPKEIKTGELHAFMLHAIAPRPIAFASTIDKNGKPNLSPFSFFNAFGSKPPIVVFSPARRVRDNTIKHTLENVYETKEVVINSVNYAMVQQASLSSCEYPKGVNEFEKAGLTAIASEIVKPFRVKESPVQMECKVLQVIETGDQGGAANLIVCEILLMHINDDILNEEGKMIDQNKIDLVARMGADIYCRASGSALFKVAKPNLKLGIGIDSIPEKIRLSHVLSGNDLGKLGNVEKLPSAEEINEFVKQEEVKKLKNALKNDKPNADLAVQLAAKRLLAENKVEDAWKLLLMEI
ncbi:MAG TPA: flavin reductase family protein [Bacteroidia bacterium]|nr:flavin reductase family protein [Bacteroidia bacterium]